MRSKKNLFIILAVFVVVTMGIFLINYKYFIYTYGNNLYESGRYEEAIDVLERIPDYKDSNNLITESHNIIALDFFEKGRYEDAITHFRRAADNQTEENVAMCYGAKLTEYIKNGKYDEANIILGNAGSDLLGKDFYIYADQLYDEYYFSKGDEELNVFLKILPIGEYKENLIIYHNACKYEKECPQEALVEFCKLDTGYKDVAQHIDGLSDLLYEEAQVKEWTSYAEAIEIYRAIPTDYKDVKERLLELGKYEAVMGTYNLKQRNTNNSIHNPEATFTVDCYYDGEQTMVIIPDTFYEDWGEKRNCPISYIEGKYYVDMTGYNGDPTVTYSAIFEGNILQLTHDVQLDAAKSEGNGILGELGNLFLEGWGVWLDSSTIEIWQKS